MSIQNGISTLVSRRPIDTCRPLRVIVIGGGVSGITAAIKLRQSVANLDLTVYEKNTEFGGTWFENRYPGCACDIPAHSYQLSFESNPTWSKFYAEAPEILRYWISVAEKYDLRPLARFSHNVEEARWDEATAQWNLKIRNMLGDSITDETCDFLITAIGLLNKWDFPSIPGLHSFKGELMHSAEWKTGFDAKDKRIAVIGSGSSGIQIVPSLQPIVQRLDHFVRGRTWIATPMANQMIERKGVESENMTFTEDQIQAWLRDPASYLAYRKEVEMVVQSGHDIVRKGSTEQQEARAYFQMLMSQRLANRPEILSHMLPNFPPLCKRLTPGPGYLEALTASNVDVVTDKIERVTELGILTADGKVREVDAIVCATGFDTSHTNRFPIYGIGGVQLGEKWKRENASTYLSLSTAGFPNMFMFLGPNSGVGAGSLLIILERVADYVSLCLSKVQRENIQSIVPKKAAVELFTKYCDEYFEGTVYSENCSSWYKAGGNNDRVTALWPGSSLHAIEALAKPRWEDYDYTYGAHNPIGWLGNGSTQADNSIDADKSYYLTSKAFVSDSRQGGTALIMQSTQTQARI